MNPRAQIVRETADFAYYMLQGVVDFGKDSICATWSGTLGGGFSVPDYTDIVWADDDDHTREWDIDWRTNSLYFFLPVQIQSYNARSIGNGQGTTYLGIELMNESGVPIARGVSDTGGLFDVITSQTGTVGFGGFSWIPPETAGWDGKASGLRLVIGIGQALAAGAWIRLYLPRPCLMMSGGY